MNVVPRTFVSPRSRFLVATFTTQSEDFASLMTSAGYSQEMAPVNASDRPQSDKGNDSSSTAPLQEQATPFGGETLSQDAGQRHCFRLDLASPYGHVLV